MTGDFKLLAQWLREHDRIAIVPHVNPDGDALGSGLALQAILRRIGKQACLVLKEPAPAMFRFLPGCGGIAETAPFEAACLLFEDVSDLKRRGDGGSHQRAELPSAMLDHHETTQGFCDVNAVDGKAAATGVLVMRLMREMGISADRELAVWLYTAISTDTGNFSFSNTDAEAARCLAELLETGFDLPEINRRLYRLRSRGRTRLLGRVLNNIELYCGGRIALSRLTAEDYRACGAVRADTEGAISYLNEMEGVQAAILAEERPEEGVIKFSFRANGAVSVSDAAAALGGGGHRQAAGASLACPMDEAVEKALQAVKKAVEES